MNPEKGLGLILMQPSERMDVFIEKHAQGAERAWYARESPPSDTTCCPRCRRDLSSLQGAKCGLYRCLDCPLTRTQCSRCILDNHQMRPFDRIRRWNVKRQLWEKVSVPDLGFILYLGHDGDPCPSIPTTIDGTFGLFTRTRAMVVVHEYGHTDIRALFCQCADPAASEGVQLLERGLWPATWVQPRTAMTLGMLETFHSLSQKAHVNVNDYEAHLKRMTDAVLTEDVKVRSHVLAHAPVC